MAATCFDLSNFVQFLEGYRGRDKFIRLLNYTFSLLSGITKRYGKSVLAEKFGILASEMGNLRVLLRLFDDSSMFLFSSSYGLGSKEKDGYLRVFQLIQNLVDQCYYPLEHIAWARDVKILSGTSDKLWSFGCFIWLISLSMGLLSAFRKFYLLKKLEDEFLRNKKCEGDLVYQLCSCGADKDSRGFDNPRNHSSTCSLRRKLVQFSQQRKHLLITIFEHTCEAVNAVHWLPKGFLWASKLPEDVVGLLGTIATICQLYKMVYPLRIKDDC